MKLEIENADVWRLNAKLWHLNFMKWTPGGFISQE